jgi:hypothetical protein
VDLENYFSREMAELFTCVFNQFLAGSSKVLFAIHIFNLLADKLELFIINTLNLCFANEYY